MRTCKSARLGALKLGVVISIWACATGSAHAQVVSDVRLGVGLNAVGPATNNGFPAYYTANGTGQTVEPCLTNPLNNSKGPGTDLCGLSGFIYPQGDQSPLVIGTNFVNEFFYASAQSTLTLPSGAKVTYVNALLGSFLPAPWQAGNQTVFSRFRLIITGSLAPLTTYTLTHPFGAFTFTTPQFSPVAGNPTAAFDGSYRYTIDNGCLGPPCGTFNQVLTTNIIGGFLEWNPAAANGVGAPPVGYLGDPNVLSPVKGSPTGNNLVRFQGPGIDVQSDLFSVTGKRFAGVPPPMLNIDRTTYSNTASGRTIDILARSAPNATVTATLGGVTQTLNSDNAGHFSKSFASTAPAGSAITLTAAVSGASATLPSILTDQIIVDGATYDSTGALTVQAHSSDQSLNPVLTVQTNDRIPIALGTTSAGVLSKAMNAPPGVIKITSTQGGAAVQTVHVLNSPLIIPTTKASSTTTLSLAAGSTNPSAVGTVSFVATVPAGATGSVTFTDTSVTPSATLGTVPLVAGARTATLTTTLTAGVHSIVASYSGDAQFLSSASSALSQTVQPPTTTPTSTTISGGGTVTRGKGSVTLTAIVNPSPTGTNPGTVTFTSSGAGLPTVVLTSPIAGGLASVSYAPANNAARGTYVFTATYTGSATFGTSTSANTVTVVVN